MFTEDLEQLRGEPVSKLLTQGSGPGEVKRVRPTEVQGLTQAHQEPSMRPSRPRSDDCAQAMPRRLLGGGWESQTIGIGTQTPQQSQCRLKAQTWVHKLTQAFAPTDPSSQPPYSQISRKHFQVRAETEAQAVSSTPGQPKSPYGPPRCPRCWRKGSRKDQEVKVNQGSERAGPFPEKPAPQSTLTGKSG